MNQGNYKHNLKTWLTLKLIFYSRHMVSNLTNISQMHHSVQNGPKEDGVSYEFMDRYTFIYW